ncbi:hypothetical protein Ancab_030915 [Ancistrocladus abbreviatus]
MFRANSAESSTNPRKRKPSPALPANTNSQAFADHAKRHRNNVSEMNRPTDRDLREEPVYAPEPLRMILPAKRTSAPGLFIKPAGNPGPSSGLVPPFRAPPPPPSQHPPPPPSQHLPPGFGGPAAADGPANNLQLLANKALSLEEIMALVGIGDGVEQTDSSEYPKPKSPLKGDGGVGDEVNSRGAVMMTMDGGDDDHDFDVIL